MSRSGKEECFLNILPENNYSATMNEQNDFKARVLTLMVKVGIPTQAALAGLVGVTRQHLGAVLNGRVEPGRELLESLARVLMVSVSELLSPSTLATAQATNGSPFIPIPLRAASGSMGSGALEGSRRIKTHLAFREDWAYQKGSPSHMSVIRATGSSMSPTIPDGCMVLIDESQTELLSGRVYYVAMNEEYFIKRMVKAGGKWFMESDGDGSRVEVKAHDHFEVFGRALWYGCEL